MAGDLLDRDARLRPAEAARVFDAELESALLSHLSLDDRLLLRVAATARRRLLRAAREGRLAAAERFLEEAEAVLALLPAHSVGPLVGKTFNAAASAYIRYVHAEYGAALELLRLSLTLDARLIEEWGLDIMELHRIQLAHNWCRVLAKTGQAQGAISVARALLEYVEDDDAPWPICGLGLTGSKPHLSGDRRWIMCSQIAADLSRRLGASLQLTERLSASIGPDAL